METRFAADIQDQRFVPYLQLHEFEALILADVVRLAGYYPHRKKALQRLADALDHDFESPEHVNRRTPPSYRIKTAVPEYQKSLAGVITLLDIGIDKVRGRCRHFSAWLAKLEDLCRGSGVENGP